MEALAGERIEEAGRVADEQPARTRPDGSTRCAERPGARHRSVRLRPCAPAAGSSSVGGIAATIRSGDGRAPSRAEVGPPRPPEHDADIDPAAGHRRDPDVAVAQDAHPGIAARVRVGIGKVVRQADPRSRAGPAARRRPPARHDRMQAVRADDDRAHGS